MQTVCFFLYRRPPPRARLRRQLAVAPVVCPVPSLFFFVSSLPPPPPFNLDEYEQTCPGIERVESLPLRAEKYGKTKLAGVTFTGMHVHYTIREYSVESGEKVGNRRKG